MKKITMMAACFALLLSSCVTNEESQSVTDIRNAKAEQLKSLAALNNAEAETAKVLAAAEAAYKAAEAELKKAEAAKLAADAENEKVVAEAQAELLKAQAALEEAEAALKAAEAALKAAEAAKLAADSENEKLLAEAEAEKIRAEAAKILEDVEKSKLEYDALKAEYAARIAAAEQAKAEAEKAKADAIAAMELAKVTAEKELVKAQKQLAEQKQQLKEKLEQIEAENAVTIEALYAAYVEATGYYQQAVIDLNSMKSYVAGLQAGLVSSEEALAALLESYESDIEDYVNAIALAEAKIATLEEYKGVPAEEIRAALVEANANHFALSQAYLAAAEVVNDMEAEFLEKGSFKAPYLTPETYTMWDTEYAEFMGEFYTNYEYILDLEEKSVNAAGEVYEEWDYVKSMLDLDQTVWVGANIEVENEDGTKVDKWLPLFSYETKLDATAEIVNYGWMTGIVSTPNNFIEYTLEGDNEVSKEYYNKVLSVGEINAENFKTVFEYVANDLATANDDLSPMIEELKTVIETLEESVMPAAKAWNDAYEAWYAANDDVTTDNEETTLGKYNAAVGAEEDAKTAYDAAVEKVDDLKEDLAYYDTKEYLWSLEDAVEDATEADAAKETLKAKQDALKAAQDTLVVKNTAAAKAVEALEAAKVKEREALKAWEAKQKETAAAQKVVDEAGEDVTDVQTAALAAAQLAETAAYKAYTNPAAVEDKDKGAVQLREDAEEALSEANQAVEIAEGAVETAENAVETAQAAADEAAEALVAAKTALDNLKAGKDVNVLELKKQLAWAEEDAKALKTVWDEAVKAVEEAEAALEAAKALVPELKAVLDAGDLQRAYEVALKPIEGGYYTGGMIDYYLGGVSASGVVDAVVELLQTLKPQYDQYTYPGTDSMAMYVEMLKAAEADYEKVVVLLEAANEDIAEFNEFAKAYAEANVASQLANRVAQLAYAEVTALNTALSEATDPDGIAAQIAALEGEIESAKGAIEGIEEAIEQAKAAVDNNQDVVALWESQLASVQAYVELCEAKVAAAKAEFDAAVEAAAKAE